MGLVSWNCYVMWKYANITWLERRQIWVCQVEVCDLLQGESKSGLLLNSQQMSRCAQGCKLESFTPKQVYCPSNCLEWNIFICLRI